MANIIPSVGTTAPSGLIGNSPGTGASPKPSIPFWDDSPIPTVDPSTPYFSPWDVLHIGNLIMPGLTDIEPTCHKDIKINKPKGGKSATLVYQGDYPSGFSVRVRIWTSNQLQFLAQSIMPILKPPRGSLAHGTPVQVVHPQLTLLGIYAVLIRDVGTLKTTGTPGVRELTFKAVEYWPPDKLKQNVTQVGIGVSYQNDDTSNKIFGVPGIAGPRSNPQFANPPSKTQVGP